jgi:hypothetical protein
MIRSERRMIRNHNAFWIPACAGMTKDKRCFLFKIGSLFVTLTPYQFLFAFLFYLV